MSLQVEKMEKNMAKLTIEVSAEDLEKAMQNAYQKAKGRITIPGFRKGKAPRKMIEQMYGKGIFLEDAVNALIPEHYSKAMGESELEIVSQPKIDLVQAEPGKELIFTAEVAVKPEVTLGEYKGVEVPKSDEWRSRPTDRGNVVAGAYRRLGAAYTFVRGKTACIRKAISTRKVGISTR